MMLRCAWSTVRLFRSSTYLRTRSCTTVAGADYCGVMVSRRAKLFGVRLHLTITTNQVVDQWMLAPASHHDGTLTPALLEESTGLWVLGDNAFHNPMAIAWLQQQREIAVMAVPRRTQTPAWPKSVRQHTNNVRRTIESALSVLGTVFYLEQPGSRSLAGLVRRITTRVLASTLSFVVWAFLPLREN